MKRYAIMGLVLLVGVAVGVLREPYHRPDCKWAQRIAPENLVGYDSKEDAEADGHRPCKACRP